LEEASCLQAQEFDLAAFDSIPNGVLLSLLKKRLFKEESLR